MPIAEQNHGNCRQWDPTAGAPALPSLRCARPEPITGKDQKTKTNLFNVAVD